MPVDLAALVSDLRSETAALDRLLDGIDARAWETRTPAPGWTVHDQVTHLAYFDEAATIAATNPTAFALERDRVGADVGGLSERIAAEHRDLAHAEVRDWFHRARTCMIDSYLSLDPSQRMPWYGPEMSIASSLTARIMETWAHGQDVADALGVVRLPTRALRQVSHLCVRTLPNSFRTNDLAVPTSDIYVTLIGPEGDRWSWGDESCSNRVDGDAIEFCLVCTQRRHVADTSLSITGDVAMQWMNIAQAFAGPRGAGREPGARHDQP